MARQTYDDEHEARRDKNVHGHTMPRIPFAHLRMADLGGLVCLGACTHECVNCRWNF